MTRNLEILNQFFQDQRNVFRTVLIVQAELFYVFFLALTLKRRKKNYIACPQGRKKLRMRYHAKLRGVLLLPCLVNN